MELCSIENAKIACAKAQFAAISSESMTCDAVDSFRKLMEDSTEEVTEWLCTGIKRNLTKTAMAG